MVEGQREEIERGRKGREKGDSESKEGKDVVVVEDGGYLNRKRMRVRVIR